MAPQTQAAPTPTEQISEQDFLLALKTLIDRVYQDGLDRFLSWDVDGESIVGTFQDGAKAFDFTLSADGVDYGPSQSATQQVMDSLLVDYPFLRDKPDGYAHGFVLSLRSDATTGKKRNCSSPTSYSCGNGCINNEKRCRVKGASIASPEEVQAVVGAAKQLKASGKGGALQQRPQIPPMAGAAGKAGAIAAGAALLGVSVGTYTVFRNNYRKGFEESARQAKEMAKGIEVDDLPDDKLNVTFTVGGFSGDASGGDRLKENLSSLKLPEHHFVAIANEEFDIRTPEEAAAGIDLSDQGDAGSKKMSTKEWVSRGMRAFMRNVLQQGRNPVSVKTAAQAYAYHQKYPDRPITLVGHSAGGITVRETAEILKGMGIKTKVVAIGSPWFGLNEPTEDNITVGSRQDNITVGSRQDNILQQTGYSTMNGVWMNSVKGHQQKEYFADDAFREFMQLTLQNPKARRDSWRADKGKPCGKGFIAEDKECRAGQGTRSPKQSQSLNTPKAKQVKTLPTSVRNGVIAGASLLGLSVGAFMVQRDRFQRGFSKSAEMAKTQASEYFVPDKLQSGFRATGHKAENKDVPDVKSTLRNKEPDQISFFVGGFGGVSGKEGDLIGEEFSAMFPNHHVVGVESPEFDITAKEGDRVYHPSFLMRAAKTVVGDALKEGRNPVAVRLAARAYAYHQKYPDKPLNLIGQSGGGMPVREAAEILERMGVKDVRVVTTASPYFGLTKPQGMTLISNNDPIDKILGASMPNKRYVNAKGHSLYYVQDGKGGAKDRAIDRRNGESTEPNSDVQRVLTDYFDRSKSRQDAAEATPNQKRFIVQLRNLLERSYTDGITRFMDIQIADNGDVSGVFRDGNKLVEFSVTDKSVTTRLSKRRSDSLNELRYVRWDRGRKVSRKRQCEVGLSCGIGCIAANKTCRIASKNLATSGEIQSLRSLAVKVKSPSGATPTADPLDEMDIRQLKAEARKQGVYRYSYMTKDELKSAIRTVGNQSGAQEERIRRTLERRKAEKEAIEGTKAGSYAKTWKQLEKILKIAGVRPDLAAGALAAVVVGTTYKVYQDMRSHYRDGLKESADAAKARAEKIDVPRSRKPNITFAVGGFRGDGSTGGEIKQRLEESDDWFKRSHDVIPFDSDDFDIPPTNIPKKNSDGSYNPAYLGYVATQGFGQAFKNFYKQRNEGAVELAAQIYAQANSQRKINGKLVPVNQDKTINIVAHGAGGLTAREALDILAEMPEGRKVLQRINLISMGSPDFGFTDKTLDREITLSGTGDPWSVLPTRKEKRIPSVKGHEIEDYLKNEDALAQITRFLGKGKTSTYYEEERLRRERVEERREKRKYNRKNRTNKQPESKQDSYAQGFALALARKFSS